MTKTIEAAEATRVLRGARIRTVGRRAVGLAMLAPPVAAAVVLIDHGISSWVAAAVTGAVLVVEAILVRVHLTAGTRRNNDGVEALSLGELDRAEEGFRSIVVRRFPARWTALGLQNLAVLALRKGELDNAVALDRAALEIHARSGIKPPAATLAGHFRANYAFALLCTGEVDEAEAVLRSPLEPGAMPLSAALMARSRALCAIRRSRFDEALAIIESERRLLRNVLTGHEAVLAEVMEALCLRELGARAPRPVGRVAADADQRSYVLQILSGTEDLLIAA